MDRLPLEALFAGNVPQMTALVGAGGKSTLMYALAERLVALGRRVVCTTTTKIFPPEDGVPLLLLETETPAESLSGASLSARFPERLVAVREALRDGWCVVADRLLPEVGKLAGLTPQVLAALAQALPEVVFLVEADGAARKPLKAPAPHEPVWPEAPDCCVAVIGLDSVGCPLDDAHVHRAVLACAVAGQEPGTPVTPLTLARLVNASEGLFRGYPACRRLVFVNKADLPGASDTALKAAHAAGVHASVGWFAGSAAQGWCVPLAGKALGIVPFRDLP